jgi:hypothetical protein
MKGMMKVAFPTCEICQKNAEEQRKERVCEILEVVDDNETVQGMGR